MSFRCISTCCRLSSPKFSDFVVDFSNHYDRRTLSLAKNVFESFFTSIDTDFNATPLLPHEMSISLLCPPSVQKVLKS